MSGRKKTELDRAILSLSDPDVKFGFLRLGPLCNASESNAFSSARCNITNIKNKHKRHYSLKIRTLFDRGFKLLENYHLQSPSLTSSEDEAIKKLENFFKEKDTHQESLNEVLPVKKEIAEGKIIVALAEHLFKKLAPGQEYLIDNKTKGKDCCPCVNCKEYPKAGNTDIGHAEGWHGSIDIVLSSRFVKKDTDAAGAKPKNTNFPPYIKDDKEDDPAKRNIIEVKRSLSEKKFETMDQAIAQTIAFSFLQRKALAKIYFVPNILIDPKEFRVIMYDSVNDILICSQPLSIFTESSPPTSSSPSKPNRSLNDSSIIILWMVLHYEMFLTDIVPTSLDNGIDIKIFQANFEKRAKSKFNVYVNELKFLEGKLESTEQDYFPTLDDLKNSISEDVFQTIPRTDQTQPNRK